MWNGSPLPVPQLLRPRTTRGRSSTACRSRSPRDGAGAARGSRAKRRSRPPAMRPLRLDAGTRSAPRHYVRRPMRWPSRTSFSSPVVRSIAVGHGIAGAGCAWCSPRTPSGTTVKASASVSPRSVVAALDGTPGVGVRARGLLVPSGVAVRPRRAVARRHVAWRHHAADRRPPRLGIGIAMPDLEGIERAVALAVARRARRVDWSAR